MRSMGTLRIKDIDRDTTVLQKMCATESPNSTQIKKKGMNLTAWQN